MFRTSGRLRRSLWGSPGGTHPLQKGKRCTRVLQVCLFAH